MSADRIIELYERHALAWDEDRTRDRTLPERPWLDRFLALVAPSAPLLDLGCGGGRPLAAYLLDAGRSVTGIDTSPRLIALCQSRFPRGEWLVGDIRTLSLGRTFGGIVAWHSFFHLSPADQRATFARFREHAAPRAALLFTTGPAAGETIGTYQGEPLYHASLNPDEYRALLGQHGFELVAHQAEDPTCGHATLWLARFRQVAPAGSK